MLFLIVDDSSTMRRIIINTLGRIGYTRVLEAANGREGLERLGEHAVDVVITAWNMPEMNGLAFVRAIRGQEATRSIPVLMVTTNAAEDDIVQGIRAGVSTYVVKPFTPDTLKAKIDSAVRSEATAV